MYMYQHALHRCQSALLPVLVRSVTEPQVVVGFEQSSVVGDHRYSGLMREDVGVSESVRVSQ